VTTPAEAPGPWLPPVAQVDAGHVYHLFPVRSSDRDTLQRHLQAAGIDMAIESFGPWGQVCHGHPSSYDIPSIFACYKVGVGTDYTTVPTSHVLKDVQPKDAAGVFYTLAHMAGCHMPLFFPDGKRAALCTWSGDVWIVSGVDGDRAALRFAGGTFWGIESQFGFAALGVESVTGEAFIGKYRADIAVK
jgi:hypothetical protein